MVSDNRPPPTIDVSGDSSIVSSATGTGLTVTVVLAVVEPPAVLASISTLVGAVTCPAVAETEYEPVLATTVTLDGRPGNACAGLAESWSGRSAVGVGLTCMSSVPWAPLVIGLGEKPKVSVSGLVLTVNIALAVADPSVAVTLTEVVCCTVPVAGPGVRVPVSEPALMCTVVAVGIGSALLSLELSVTSTPPVGAGCVSWTVTAMFVLGPAVVGSSETDLMPIVGVAVGVGVLACWIVSPAVLMTPDSAAVSVTTSVTIIGPVACWNVTPTAPAGIVMLAGNGTAFVSLLLSETCVPPVGAACASVMVMDGLSPSLMDEGRTMMPVRPLPVQPAPAVLDASTCSRPFTCAMCESRLS